MSEVLDEQPGQPQHPTSADSTAQQTPSPSPSSSSTPAPVHSAGAAAHSDASSPSHPSSNTNHLNGTHEPASTAASSVTNSTASHPAPPAASATHNGDTVGLPGQPSSDASTSTANGAQDAASRKRQSRWGDTEASSEPGAAPSAESRKRSRWGDKDASSPPTPAISTALAAPAGATPAMAAALTAAAIAAKLGQPGFAPASVEEVRLQLRIDELSRLMNSPLAQLSSDEPRSPEPEPTYDSQGQRTNTREQRYKLRYATERNDLILQLTAANSSYRPPSDWKKQTRFERRVYIPVRDYPDYNFIGLIIGPRGSTQKQMEKETGCKIVIRGKGSSKEGKSRTSGRPDESENDDTHVLVTGDDRAKVDSAAAMVEKLMVPVDDATNEHKSKQLRELALINGTLRDDIVCRVCGQRGHKLFECPERTGAAWKPAEVKCEWCGETSHISTDCPRREEGREKREEWDAEYASFMNEITGGSLQDKGISGLLDDNRRSAQGEAGAGRGRDEAGRLGEGGRSGQLMLTDGVDRRPSNTLRVGDGIVRRIISNDPRESAREYRPLNPPPSSSQQSPPNGPHGGQAPASGYIHPSRMHPSAYHAVPPPTNMSRPPHPPPPPQPPGQYGAYPHPPPPQYPYHMPPPGYYHPPPPYGASAGGSGAAYPPYYPPPPPVPPQTAAPPSHAPTPLPPPPLTRYAVDGGGGEANAPVSAPPAAASPAAAGASDASRVNRYQQWPPPSLSATRAAPEASSPASAAPKPASVNKFAVWPPPSL